jgi:antitoxin ParD1/3/4
MSDSFPLPPEFEGFVREQLAAGRFRSEGELLRTALRILAERVAAPALDPVWLKRAIDEGLSSKPAPPAGPAFWDDLRTRVRTAARERDGD